MIGGSVLQITLFRYRQKYKYARFFIDHSVVLSMNKLAKNIVNKNRNGRAKLFDKFRQTSLIAFFLLSISSYSALADNELPTLGDSTSGLISLNQEHDLGRLWLRQLRSQTQTIEDPLTLLWFSDLIYRLVPHSNLSITELELVVVDSPELNAFAVPGGIIGINMGLMLYAADEDQFASVLAHELAHLSQRHFARQVEAAQRREPLALASMLASILLIATNNAEAGFAGLLGSQAASIQNQLAYTRDFEREADRLGMQTLYTAGFDPNAMTDMFNRMMDAARYRQTPPEFLMTHPLTSTRIADAADRAQQLPRQPRLNSFEYSLLRLTAEQEYQLKDNSQAEFQRRLSKADAEQRAALSFRLADIALTQNRISDAQSLIDKVLAPWSDHPATVAMKARILYASGDASKAIEILNRELLLYPNHLILEKNLADIMNSQKQYSEAILLWRDILKRWPTTPSFWKDLSVSAAANDDNVLAYRALAESLYYSGKRQEALLQFERALKEATKIRDFQRELALQARIKEIKDSPDKLPG